MSRANVSIEVKKEAHRHMGPILRHVRDNLFNIMEDMNRVCNKNDREMRKYMTLLNNVDDLRCWLEDKMFEEAKLDDTSIYYPM